jgi:hypothetical protein
MPTILIVEKTGNIKTVSFTGNNIPELAKKSGHKTIDGFALIETWNITLLNEEYCISLFGKTTGKANQENKYEFPPPVDTQLFFGSCVLLRTKARNSLELLNLTEKEWSNIYDYLYGGFEDLNSESDGEGEGEGEGEEFEETKIGFKKDGFVVDDDEEENENEELIEETTTKKTKRKNNITSSLINSYYNCENELSEEEYV